jgi:hypothetical protein
VEHRSDSDDEPTEKPSKLYEVRDSLDLIINDIIRTLNAEIQAYYEHTRTLSKMAIHQQQQRYSQLKMNSFLSLSPSTSVSVEESV